MRTRCLFWFLASASLFIWSQALEEEEEDPSRSVSEGQVDLDDRTSNKPLDKLDSPLDKFEANLDKFDEDEQASKFDVEKKASTLDVNDHTSKYERNDVTSSAPLNADQRHVTKRRHRHEQSRHRRIDGNRQLVWLQKGHRSYDVQENDLHDALMEKKRRRKKRLRHKKFGQDDIALGDDATLPRFSTSPRLRRKSFRRPEPILSASTSSRKDKPYSSKTKKPNIVLIMTDDQDVELGSLQFMPKLNRYLRKEGVSFDHGFVSTPMCCPSRSSMLTGLYVHNHNVLTNNDNCSSPMWIEKHEPRTFAKYLNDVGYKTGYFGKYLNKYNGNRIPDGWDEWTALIRNSRFYNYTLNVNGNKVKHGFDYAKDYFPDLITNDSLAFFRQSKQRKPNQPVLMVMAYPGPHGPEDSAPQYSDLFFNVTTHHTPAYDYAPNPDKQWVLQVTDRMEPIHKKFTDFLMTKRLQTLQSIDDAVERLYHELDALGELDNTYIFYTSDHGYHLGQFGLVKGKSFPFDVDTKVPFIVRGPGIDWGTHLPEPVVNIDLAPTFLDLAGINPLPIHMDGRSIVPLLNKTKNKEENGEELWRHAFLIERGKMTTSRYQKIQLRDEIGLSPLPPLPNATIFFDDDENMLTGLPNMTLEDNDDALEDDDDKQTTNTNGNLATSHFLDKERLTKQERLAVECLKPRLQAPCQLYQRHKCVRRRNGLWKIKRCHPHLNNEQESPSVTFPFYDDVISEDSNGSRNSDCVCENGEENSDNFFSSAEKREKRLQRRFIKKHLATNGHRLRHKFLKDIVHDDVDEDTVKSLSNRRSKRDDSSTNESQDSASPDVETVLTDLADQDIVEVDIIMDDIYDEIKDLQDSIVVDNTTQANSSSSPPNELQCQLLDEKIVNCSSQVYSNKDAWRSSRSYINDQIRRLRAQLSELKEIRKHLKMKRPYDMFDDQNGSSDVIVDEQQSEEGVKPIVQKEKCRCKKLTRRDRQMRERDLRMRRREKLKLARLQRRLRRKEQNRRRLKKQKNKRKRDSCSVDSEKLNCFTHNNEHWKTAPLWTDGSFCACTNSNTNTYSCVRNINATHNYLYCEFVSGTITYYNLKIDPHQLRNIYQTLSYGELNYMHKQLLHLKRYKGKNDLEPGSEKVMGEYGNPAQISKKTPFRAELQENVRAGGAMRQEKFIKKYGQFLPPPNAYQSRW